MDIVSAFAPRERRIRVVFTAPVASGAFNKTLYSVTAEDSSSASPAVRAVYAVAGQPTQVELVIEFDLVNGSAYIVGAGSVPAAAGGSTPSDASTRFRFAMVADTTDVEPIVSDFDVILFGRDIVWNGTDFEEGGDGDLVRVSGVPNALSAIDRRLNGTPLPYAVDYGPNAREFVDSVDATPLGARLRQQTLRDPRVESVTVTAQENDNEASTTFTVTPVFIGKRKPGPISVTVDT